MGSIPERLRRALAPGPAGLSRAGRELLLELSLCFTTRGAEVLPEPFEGARALALLLGLAPPEPGTVRAAASPELQVRLASIPSRCPELQGDLARAALRCLFVIGVCRGSLTPTQRQIVARVAKATGVPMAELNDIAQAALREAREEEDALPEGVFESSDALENDLFAIVSDIHANIAALEAVLADIDGLGVRRIVCLGDVVGYGPDPVPCAERIMARCKWTLMGNHDIALFEGSAGFNPSARGAIDWTRDLLFSAAERDPAARRRCRFLRDLPLQHEEGGNLFVHGSPRDPWREYIFPDEARLPKARKKFREIFPRFERFLFVGHTHIPCVITEEGFVATSTELGNQWKRPPGVKAIVNVGSVGQPRDRDSRACYLVVEGDSVVWRRVTYDVQATVGRIHANPVLDPALAVRLKKGV